MDLSATPRSVTRDLPLPFSDIDAGFCDADGVKVFKGSQYYQYESAMLLAMGRIAPRPLMITSEMMGCRDEETAPGIMPRS